MLRLVVLGPHTHLLSDVCAACPHSPAGCCIAPPEMDWSDAGRVVALGGAAWLEGEIAARRLLPSASGLRLRKVKAVARPDGPKLAKCTYHAEAGCTIAQDRRPATCNYYVCESVYDEGRVSAAPARDAHRRLAAAYAAWDAELAARVAERWPEGAPWDAAFLAWLGEAFTALAARDAASLPEHPPA